ncbi:hypothetical protein, conserved [Eimeria praecox]|uniref:Uncharacterized protein n=1 Tax=Eimeria praecox TaxID=51316 RepID=U6GZN5_9EIME|nr:hypothetical protein, conserved [Eimeria praecox]
MLADKFTEEEIYQLARLLMTSDGLVDCRKLYQLVDGPPPGLLMTSDGLVDCRKLYQLVDGPPPETSPPADSKGPHGCSLGAPSTALQIPNASSGAPSNPLGYPRSTLQEPGTFMGAGEAFAERHTDDGSTARSSRDTKRSWAREKRSVLEKIETGVGANQLPLRESFRDFDGLRKGVCTIQQAQAVLLSMLRLPLGENDWESLLEQFVRPDGMFEYDRLCKRIESSLTNPEAQQYPTRVVPIRTPTELRLAQEDKTTMTEEELGLQFRIVSIDRQQHSE